MKQTAGGVTVHQYPGTNANGRLDSELGEKKMRDIDAASESLLPKLCQKARELGASEAVALPITDVVVDERARLKCMVPVCASYGRSPLCPPGVMPISEFKRILANYHSAVLLKLDVELSQPPEQVTAQENLAEAWQVLKPALERSEETVTPIGNYLYPLRDSQQRLYEIIGAIESLCIAEGFPFAAGLGSGWRSLCDECIGIGSGLPCRHPFRARPSMEALGVDVIATARKARMPLSFAKNESRNRVGLVLVD